MDRSTGLFLISAAAAASLLLALFVFAKTNGMITTDTHEPKIRGGGGHRIYLHSEKHTAKFYSPKFLADQIRQGDTCAWHNRFPRCRFESKYDAASPTDVAIVMAGSQVWDKPLRTDLDNLTQHRRPEIMGVYYTEAHADRSGKAYEFRVALAKGAEVKLHVSCEAMERLTRLSSYGKERAERSFHRPNGTAGFISNCVSPFRNSFIQELMNHTRIDQYGGCFNNVQTPGWARKVSRAWGVGKVKMLDRYKIALAVENQAVDSYVSEKVYQALEAGAIPIYYGARDVSEFVPRGSYIDARDFKSTKRLAEYIEALKLDRERFGTYFEWGKEDVERIWTKAGCGVHWLCRACDVVEALARERGGAPEEEEQQQARARVT